MGEGMRNKIRKKILSLLLAGILAAGLCGCGQEAETQKTRVAMIVKSTESAFWKSVFAGAGAAATEYNINVSFDGPAAEEDYETQNEMVLASWAAAHTAAPEEMPTSRPSLRASSRPVAKASSFSTVMISS